MGMESRTTATTTEGDRRMKMSEIIAAYQDLKNAVKAGTMSRERARTKYAQLKARARRARFAIVDGDLD